MQTQYKASVIVVTYNPSEKKLRETLRSILLQKNITYQIVIADDGSKTPCFEAAEALFAQWGFADYVIVANPTNRGTVYNVLSGVERSSGEYVKVISPGDMLGGENVLCQWIEAMEGARAQLSFSDAVCYCTENDTPVLTQGKAHPQVVECYLGKDTDRIRWNYLIFDDLMLGAAVVCRREILQDYLQQIAGKVVYAEDNAYRLMAYDGITMFYYPEEAVIYELGTGISTSNNDVWKERLVRDWNACTRLVRERCTGKNPLDVAIWISAHGSLCKKAVKTWRILTDKEMRRHWKSGRQNRLTGRVLPGAFLGQIIKTEE